jgi:uncharacterized membrane protein YobD (UPF0266 family)
MSTEITSILLLSLIFISIHLVFLAVFLIYFKRRFVAIYSRIFYIEQRLNYHAVAMAENEILPMPWELEELEELQEKIKVDKEDNIVYIKPRSEQ